MDENIDLSKSPILFEHELRKDSSLGWYYFQSDELYWIGASTVIVDLNLSMRISRRVSLPERL